MVRQHDIWALDHGLSDIEMGKSCCIGLDSHVVRSSVVRLS